MDVNIVVNHSDNLDWSESGQLSEMMPTHEGEQMQKSGCFFFISLDQLMIMIENGG